MAMNKVNLTKRLIESYPAAGLGKRTYYHDMKVRGLLLMLTDKGNKSFQVYRKIKGRAVRVTLGSFPDLSVENARNMGLKVNSQFAQGINPNEEKNKIRNEITFKQMFDRYIEDHGKLHTKSWQHDIEDVNRNLSHWFKRKISTITTDEIR